MTTLNLDQTLALVTTTLDDLKAKNITTLVKALADKLGAATKEAGLMPLGREGDKDSDWTLVDLSAVVVHIMTPQAREFYDLEGLWSSPDALKALVAQKD